MLDQKATVSKKEIVEVDGEKVLRVHFYTDRPVTKEQLEKEIEQYKSTVDGKVQELKTSCDKDCEEMKGLISQL